VGRLRAPPPRPASQKLIDRGRPARTERAARTKDQFTAKPPRHQDAKKFKKLELNNNPLNRTAL
jgi:hypothetical protein